MARRDLGLSIPKGILEFQFLKGCWTFYTLRIQLCVIDTTRDDQQSARHTVWGMLCGVYCVGVHCVKYTVWSVTGPGESG
jgi:predicted CDP-diglyceride synthetase/phosphatidate cytidylyltransferase